MLLDVIEVKVLENYLLLLTFENGEVRKFDMQKYMNLKPYNRLKGYAQFKHAKVDYGTVVWPGEIDISPETLYDKSVYVKNESLVTTKTKLYETSNGERVKPIVFCVNEKRENEKL